MSSLAQGPTRQTQRLTLRKGQTHMLQAAGGSHWTVLSGVLRLQEPPRWLSENMVVHQQTLHPGQEHRLSQAGWLTLEALTPCELLYGSPLSRWTTWLDRMSWLHPMTKASQARKAARECMP